jgi:hypothetical protein
MLLTKEDKRFINEKYPWLTIYWDDLLKWVISFSASYNSLNKIFTINWEWENLLNWKYEIEIKFISNKFPEVFEINWDLKRWIDFHIYPDWKFCLTHTLFENKYKNKDFQFILEELIIPFLYNQTYNIKNWKFLWEYWHNFEWDFEFIFDNKVSKDENIEILKKLKKYLWKNKKLFLYSEKEREKIIESLKLNSKRSIEWFYKFIEYLKRNTNLFTKI